MFPWRELVLAALICLTCVFSVLLGCSLQSTDPEDRQVAWNNLGLLVLCLVLIGFLGGRPLR